MTCNHTTKEIIKNYNYFSFNSVHADARANGNQIYLKLKLIIHLTGTKQILLSFSL